MALDPREVKVFSNQRFVQLPHPNHFINCVREHVRANHKNAGFSQIQKWQEYYLAELAKGQVIHLNNRVFKAPQRKVQS